MDCDYTEEATPAEDAPEHQYAIVEIMGHRKLVGRIAEVERFGVKFLRVEPMFAGAVMGVETFVQPASIFCLTPVQHATAVRYAPTERYNLPDVIAAASAHLIALPPPAEGEVEEDTFPWNDHD